MRKIIQIVMTDNDLFALCNDGTVWAWDADERHWYRFDKDIPQNK